MLSRSTQNPIIVADPGFVWRSIKVYNPTIIKDSAGYHMLFRGIGGDWISRIGLAHSTDGTHFRVEAEPVMAPLYPWEKDGCEDPRIIKIDDTYWLTYTAFDGKTARAAIASSQSLHAWERRHLLFPDWHHNIKPEFEADWSKAAAIIPKQINGKYHMLFGDSHIWPATSDNLSDWQPQTTPLISKRAGFFDEAYVEMGPPPILTDRGWLVLYHGIDSLASNRTYRLGAALLDEHDPQKLIWRCTEPLMEPEGIHEVVGFIDVIEGGFKTLKNIKLKDLHELHLQKKLPTAIFCCGAVLEANNVVRIYYGAGDTVICTATIDLPTIFSR